MPVDTDGLFSPFTINKPDLPNRIAIVPMSRKFSPDNIHDDVVAYYRRWESDLAKYSLCKCRPDSFLLATFFKKYNVIFLNWIVE